MPAIKRDGLRLRLGSLLGVPVTMHALMLLFFVAIFGNLLIGDGLWMGLMFLFLFACGLVHEIGHLWMARRLTLKPTEIRLSPIGGVGGRVILEKPPESPPQEFRFALGGPLANVILAVLFGVVWLVIHLTSDSVLANRTGMAMFLINAGIAGFNLLPAFPLDGGRMLRAWLTPRKGRVRANLLPINGGRLLAAIVIVVGLISDFAGGGIPYWIALLISLFLLGVCEVEWRGSQLNEKLSKAHEAMTGGAGGNSVESGEVIEAEVISESTSASADSAEALPNDSK